MHWKKMFTQKLLEVALSQLQSRITEIVFSCKTYSNNLYSFCNLKKKKKKTYIYIYIFTVYYIYM